MSSALQILLTVAIPVLIAVIASQVFKALLNVILSGKFRLKMLYQDGDFPSSHTTTIITTNIVVWNMIYNHISNNPTEDPTLSILIGCVLLLWTFYEIRDAMGLRLTVQENAVLLKKLAESSKDVSVLVENLDLSRNSYELSNALQETFDEIAAKINLKAGHMPHEVLGGICLGCIVGFAAITYGTSPNLFTFVLLTAAVYFIATVFIFARRRRKRKSSLK